MEKTTFDLTLTLLEPMLGTVPKDKEVFKTYVASKHPEGAGDEEVESVEDLEEKGWTGFHIGEDGKPFIYDYMIKGFLKAAGNTLKDQLKVKALKSKIDNFVFVFPRVIPLPCSIDESPLERPLRAMTPRGERVALARSDTVPAGIEFKCQIVLLKHKEVKEKILREVLDYGALKGLGQWRNASYGRFSYEMVKVEE